MDVNEFKTGDGNCIISDEVIASIACTAAKEVPGVAGMAASVTDIRGIIAPSSPLKYVKVLNTASETVLDVNITLKQGAHIQDVASKVQHDVKTAVQSMTGKPVTKINVHVMGLQLEEKNA